MEGKDNIKELFSQKLGNYEAKVNPELWAKISSQVAAGATTTVATGLSLFTKIAIGVGVSAAAIATVVVLNSSEAPIEKETPKTEVSNPAQQNETEREAITPTNESVKANVTQNSFTESQSVPSFDNPSDVYSPARVIYSDVDGLKPRGTKGIQGTTKEPTIVEGIIYAHSGMTNYGKAPSNYPEDAVQATKPAPIKKYPNVFTPNGDTENDQFFLESEGLTDFSIVIFDPKGDIVFKSADPAFSWDGYDMRTGKLVPVGKYMYMVSAYDSEGNPFPIYEQLTIQY